jgi:cell division protein FtsN
MKLLVIFLLVVNFGLLGFFLASDYMLAHQDAVIAPPPPPYTGAIKLLSDADVAALPKKAPEPTPAPTVSATPTESCYEWGSFNTADSARALSALKKLDLQINAKAVPKQESTRYWVYIPAQKTMQEAQTKNEEIKALGVDDTVILQDAQWHNAISLGMFKDEALANKFIDKLHAMGIKNAVKAKRGFGNNQTSYTIHNVQPEQLEKLTALKPHFSTGELKQVDCN